MNAISKLHNDILYELFLIISDIEPPRPFSYIARADEDSNGSPLGCVKLTHVCRRWRTLFLNTPFLWAGIICIFPSASAFDAFLSRTLSHPISIDLTTDSAASSRRVCEHNRRINIALDCRERLKSLLYPHAERDWAPVFREKSFPTLSSLHISQKLPRIVSPDYASITIVFNTPNLTSAALKNIFPDFHLCGRLRSLKLEGCFLRSPVHRIFDVLHGLSLLEELEIHNDSHPISPLPSWESYSGPVVHLPVLKQVTIYDSYVLVAASFWKWISAPSGTKVAIIYPLMSGPPLLDSLVRQIQHPRYNAIQVKMTRGIWLPGCHYEIHLYTAQRNTVDSDHDSGVSIALDDVHIRTLLNQLSNQLSPKSIQHMDFIVASLSPFLVHGLSTLTSVTSVTLQILREETLGEVLGTEQDGSPLFPNLSSLSLCLLAKLQSVNEDKAYLEECWFMIIGAFKRRVRLGKPICTLRLFGNWDTEEYYSIDDGSAIRQLQTLFTEVIDERSTSAC